MSEHQLQQQMEEDEGEDGCSVATSDFIKIGQSADERGGQEGGESNEGRNLNTADLSFSDIGAGIRDSNAQLKWQIEALKTKNQMLEEKFRNLELEQKCANLEQKMRDQSMERKLENGRQRVEEIAKNMAMLKETHQSEMADLKKLVDGKSAVNAVNLAGRQQKAAPFSKNEMILVWLEQMRQSTSSSNSSREFEIGPEFLWNFILKAKKVSNPHKNRWKSATTAATISQDGLTALNEKENRLNIFAEFGFNTFEKTLRMDHFPGTILYYYEVTKRSSCYFLLGLSSGFIPVGQSVGDCPNSYTILNGYDYCRLDGKEHQLECPIGAAVKKPEWHGIGDVLGCGLLISPKNNFSIFFTGNGILLGKQIAIKPTCAWLYPTVDIMQNVSLEANFGDFPIAKPFKYDIHACPGMLTNY